MPRQPEELREAGREQRTRKEDGEAIQYDDLEHCYQHATGIRLRGTGAGVFLSGGGGPNVRHERDMEGSSSFTGSDDLGDCCGCLGVLNPDR